MKEDRTRADLVSELSALCERAEAGVAAAPLLIKRYVSNTRRESSPGRMGCSEQLLSPCAAKPPPPAAGAFTDPRWRSIVPTLGTVALTLLNSEVYRQAVLAAGAYNSAKGSIASFLPAIQQVMQVNRPQGI